MNHIQRSTRISRSVVAEVLAALRQELHQYEPGQTGQYQPFAHGLLRSVRGRKHLRFIGAQLGHQIIYAITHIHEACIWRPGDHHKSTYV